MQHAEQREQPLDEAREARERAAQQRGGRGAVGRGRLERVLLERVVALVLLVLQVEARRGHLHHEARHLPPDERRRHHDEEVEVDRRVGAAELHGARAMLAVEVDEHLARGGGDGDAVEEEVDRGRVALGEAVALGRLREAVDEAAVEHRADAEEGGGEGAPPQERRVEVLLEALETNVH